MRRERFKREADAWSQSASKRMKSWTAISDLVQQVQIAAMSDLEQHVTEDESKRRQEPGVDERA